MVVNCTSSDPADICNVFTGIGIGFGNFLGAIVQPLIYIVIAIGVVTAVVHLMGGVSTLVAGKLGNRGTRYR